MNILRGLWMSISPMEDALIVVLDFEGVLERTYPMG
jgi:hypothetical protein